MHERVLIIGAGGLGSPIASYLIAAGVGQIGVLDDDTVELSNLQRQIIHQESDVNKPKVDSVHRSANGVHEQHTVYVERKRVLKQLTPRARVLNETSRARLYFGDKLLAVFFDPQVCDEFERDRFIVDL